MRRAWKIIVLIPILSSVFFSRSQATRYAGEFLEIGVGGRALGMGGAYCALAEDPSAFYWNPAGLSRVPGISVWGMYANQFGSFGDPLAQHSVLGVVVPMGGAVAGLHWIRLAVDEIPIFPDYSDSSFDFRKNQIDGIPQGYFDDSEDALFITLARMNQVNLDLGWAFFSIPLEIPLGLNLKMIRQKLYTEEAWGIGADAGMQLRFNLFDMFGKPFNGSVALGITYQDFSRTAVDWGSVGGQKNVDVIPQNLRVGLAYVQPINALKSEFRFERVSNTRYPYDGRMGLEYIYDKMVSLRFGLTRLDWGKFVSGLWDDIDFATWTLGAGLRYWRFTGDYAFLKAELGNVHRLSLIYQF